ncbi:MAG: hypothetical protein P8X63_14925, partial [Desulfuromonadaceae bacterium]
MQLVAVHGWQKEEGEVAKIIADTLGTVVFEARQKIAGGGPAVVANFADPKQAAEVAASLGRQGVPAMLVDSLEVRRRQPPMKVSRFELGSQGIKLANMAGETCTVAYPDMELLLVAVCSAGMTETTGTVTERKFSLGKTLLAGGVPMTRKVTREQTVLAEDRDKALWLFAAGRTIAICYCGTMDFASLGAAKQLTRDLNFSYLTEELRRLAPQACFDDRLLKRPAMIRLLGPTLCPETDFDLALEVLAG